MFEAGKLKEQKRHNSSQQKKGTPKPLQCQAAALQDVPRTAGKQIRK